jgi:carboxyl-terminal processing protease
MRNKLSFLSLTLNPLRLWAAVLALTLWAGAHAPAQAQSLSLDRARCQDMLHVLKDDIKNNYYDPTFHGIDLDARFQAADEKLKQATSRGQMFGIIAQTLLDFKDSHLFFLPPERASRTDYGWQVQMIGDDSYIVAVKPGSDAEAKGLKPGDHVLGVDNLGLIRDNISTFKYLYYALRPRGGAHLVVQSPGGPERELDVAAKVNQGRLVMDLTNSTDLWALIREADNEDRLHRHRYYEVGNDLMIWKMPQFDLPREKAYDMMAKAGKHKALILDLRGNHGGYEETLLAMLGALFKEDTKIGDLKRRKETKPMLAKAHGSEKMFGGQLIVLVDSESGSSAEIFARVVQLQQLGTVIGDRTSGAVMRAKSYDHKSGTDVVVFYGASVTDADVILSDGKSLEKVGVMPDKLLLPTGADLAAGRDPVLAYAASLASVKLEPEKAGALFPIEWHK